MKQRYVVALGALVAATWLAVWHGPRVSKNATATRSSSDTVDLDASRAPTHAAAPRAQEPRPPVSRPPSPLATTLPSPAVSLDRAAPAEAPAVAQGGAIRSAARDSLKSAWYGEPHDDAQTQQMHSYLLETAAAAALPPEVIQETDCGATVCRVLLSFKGPEQALSFQALAQRPDLKYEINASGQPFLAGNPSANETVGETSDAPDAPVDGPLPALAGESDDGAPAAPVTPPPGGPKSMDFEVLLVANNGAESEATGSPDNAP